MKVKLEMELSNSNECLGLLKDNKGGKVTEEDIKEELTQMLFEVCEDWVIRGQKPDLEFKD